MSNKDSNENESIEYYQQLIKDGATEMYPYQRLMVLYRKEKDYTSELKTINKAINVFSKLLHSRKPLRQSAKLTTIKNLSEKFSKQTGLTDKKGNPSFTSEPIATWLKRKTTVENKLKKKK